MEKFYLYFTIVSFLIVTRGILIFPYVWIMRRTKLAHKGRSFILNRFLSSYDINTWRIFYLSILWLIVYYFDFIKELLKGCING